MTTFQDQPPKKIIFRYIFDQFISLAAGGVALFWSAGRLDWWPAWAMLGVWLAWFTAADLLLLRYNPGLLIERLSPPKGAKAWDRAILSAFRLAGLARYIVAGLDQRHAWTVGFPLAGQVAGLLVCCLGYALLTWAMVANGYFSQIVRIQSERGHAVATGGPYRTVRHPGYSGMIAFELGMSALLGSAWSFIPSGLAALLLLLRTVLEDRTLQRELDGYANYARQVRYRLLPGVW